MNIFNLKGCKKTVIITAWLCMMFLSCEKNFDTLKIVSSTPANNSTGILPDFYVEIEFNNGVNRTDIEDNSVSAE